MKNCISQLDEVVEYYRRVIKDFNWFRYKKFRKINKLTLAVMKVLLDYEVRNVNSKMSLLKIIRELLQLPHFHDVSETEIILTILLFHFDKELLKRSKELISYSWWERNLQNKVGHGQSGRRRKCCGISLVLFFKYPDKYPDALLTRLNNRVKPIKFIHRTASDHFTLMNFTTSYDKKKVNIKSDSIRRKLIKRIQTDKDLRKLITQLKKEAAINDEFHILRDGALILYGAGDIFLSAMHEIRQRLRDLTITKSNGTILNRDPQPVWTHTVFGRIGRPLNYSHIRGVRKNILMNSHGRRNKLKQYKLKQCRIGLLIFEDRKAVLKPRKEIYI
jgi:hypothetical protein